MLNRVQDYIDRFGLLDRSELHLVGLSGGADSVALLLVLKGLGYRVEAAHCNFCLRGEESSRDERFVRDLCTKMGVPLHLIHFDTISYAELHQVSIEMAARDLRYGYFRNLCHDIGAADVCIGHHRDDAVETLLMNLLRGAGIHGLTGIRPSNGIVRRPLLCLSRKEITDYLDSIGQTFVTDSTNLVDDVLRNKIRLRVLPLLEEIAPYAAANIDKTASYLSEAEKVYQAEMERELTSPKLDRIYWLGTEIRRLPISYLLEQPSPSYFLHEYLSPYGFNAVQTEQILSCIGKPGREFMANKTIVVVDRDYILMSYERELAKPMKLPEDGLYDYGDIQFRLSISDELAILKSADEVTLDADKVQFPLAVRSVEIGDRFVPFGMKGSKLVSDFMTDIKLSSLHKRCQLVVVDATGVIVWLVGLRTDNRFCVGNETKRVLRISLIK